MTAVLFSVFIYLYVAIATFERGSGYEKAING